MITAVTVEILSTRGSAPRDTGTAMQVRPDDTHGTIGGGALEYHAILKARTTPCDKLPFEETIPLGPELGQCCGGSVRLRYSNEVRPVDHGEALPPLKGARPNASPRPLWVWGAGHVGRAVVRLAAPLQAFEVTWIDTALERFPTHIPSGVTVAPAADMPRLAQFAPANADHLIFSYSHAIDFDLCAAILKRDFNSCGLIGSDTKKARFFKRLRELNLNPQAITCPIGDPAFGKHPDAIAHSTLQALLNRSSSAGNSASDSGERGSGG